MPLFDPFPAKPMRFDLLFASRRPSVVIFSQIIGIIGVGAKICLKPI
jgi:hypothetical protein